MTQKPSLELNVLLLAYTCPAPAATPAPLLCITQVAENESMNTASITARISFAASKCLRST